MWSALLALTFMWSFPGPFRLAAQAQNSGQPAVYIGLLIVDVNADRAAHLQLSEEKGVQVTALVEGGPAESAGVRVGDVLLSYNTEPILGSQQLMRLVQETPAGRKVRLEIWRDRKTSFTSIVVAALPPSRPVIYAPAGSTSVGPTDAAASLLDVPFPIFIWKISLFGIECEGVSPQLALFFGAKNGVLVRSVDPGASGERAGLRAGDMLVSIGDRLVLSPRDLNSYRRTLQAETRTIPITIVRDRKLANLQIVP